MWKNYRFEVPENKKIRYIVHSDCKNEADDQFTVVHALMTDKLEVCGLIAGHFDLANNNRFPLKGTAEASREEIEKLLTLMNLQGKYPVFKGAAEGLRDEHTPIDNAAVRFIIQEAMKDDTRPLYIGMQGALTDLASAILIEPRICKRMTCIWVGGGDYPNGGFEFNLAGDICAANILFSSEMTVWQIPCSAYKQFSVSLAELQLKVSPCGKVGEYLFEQLAAFNRTAFYPNWPHGEIWALGDEGCVCALLQDDDRTNLFSELPAPQIKPDMTYSFPDGYRKIRVYHAMDVRMALEDLFAKLRLNFANR